MTYYDLYYEKDYNAETFYSLLFSDGVNNSIKTKFNLSDQRYKSIMKILEKKTYIKDNRINKNLLHPIIKKDYTINLEFTNG